MASDVEICNRALQILGANIITSIDGNNTEARECKRAFNIIRDAELRAHPWSFARKRAQIAALATAPAFGYDNQFQVPEDFIRLLVDNPKIYGVDWQIEGNVILTDDDAPLDVVYIARITDTAKFDPLFVEAMAARMAVAMAHKLTQSTQKKGDARREYDDAISEARRINAIERPSVVPAADPYLVARL